MSLIRVTHIAQEVADTKAVFLLLARQREARHFLCRGVRREQDDVIALRGGRPEAVGGFGVKDLLRFRFRDQIREDRAKVLGGPGQKVLERPAVLLLAPVELEQHVFVQEWQERLHRHFFKKAGALKGRCRHLNAF